MTWLCILLLLEIVLFIAAVRAGVRRLINLALINMLCVSIAPLKLLTLGPLTSNLANVWYAMVFVIQLAVFEARVPEQNKRLIVAMYYSLSVFFVLVQVSAQIAPPIGSDGGLLPLLAARTMRVSLALLLAFGVGQLSLLFVYRRLQSWSFPVRFAVAILVAQVIDSLVFFPLAFDGWTELQTIIVSGLIYKFVFSLLFAPIIYWAYLRPNVGNKTLSDEGLKA